MENLIECNVRDLIVGDDVITGFHDPYPWARVVKIKDGFVFFSRPYMHTSHRWDPNASDIERITYTGHENYSLPLLTEGGYTVHRAKRPERVEA